DHLGTVYADAQCESTCGNNGFVKRPRANLKQSWNLARRLLVVSAQVLRSGRGKTPVEFGDGVRTGHSFPNSGLGTHGRETPFRVRVLRRRLSTYEHPKRSFHERVPKQSLGTRL